MNYSKKIKKLHEFDITNTLCVVTAFKAQIGEYGYFANSLSELRKAVEQGRTNMRTYYICLLDVLPETFEKRFITKVGNFSLFYPLNETEENEERY